MRKTTPTWTATSTVTTADTGTPSVTITPVMKKPITARQKESQENLKEKTMSKKEKTKMKTKLSLSLKKKTSKNNKLNRKKTSGTKLNAHIHLPPADLVVKLLVDFLYMGPQSQMQTQMRSQMIMNQITINLS